MLKKVHARGPWNQAPDDAREVAEACGLTAAAAVQAIEQAVAEGTVVQDGYAYAAS